MAWLITQCYYIFAVAAAALALTNSPALTGCVELNVETYPSNYFNVTALGPDTCFKHCLKSKSIGIWGT